MLRAVGHEADASYQPHTFPSPLLHCAYKKSSLLQCMSWSWMQVEQERTFPTSIGCHNLLLIG